MQVARDFKKTDEKTENGGAYFPTGNSERNLSHRCRIRKVYTLAQMKNVLCTSSVPVVHGADADVTDGGCDIKQALH